MAYRGSPPSGYDGGDLEEFGHVLTEIKNRVNLLARQCEAVTRRNEDARPDSAPINRTAGVPEALSHFNRSLNSYFARRFEQISQGADGASANRNLNGSQIAKPIERNAKNGLNGSPAHDKRDKPEQPAGSDLAEVKKVLAGIIQTLAELSARNPAGSQATSEQVPSEKIAAELASRINGTIKELRSDFESQITALAKKLDQQQSFHAETGRTGLVPKEAATLAQIEQVTAQIHGKLGDEAQSLARTLDAQLKRSLSTISLAQKADSELFIKGFVERIDGRLTAITETFSAEFAEMRKKTSAIRDDVDREITGRSDRKRADSADADVSIKKLQEYLDRRVSEITAGIPAEAGKNEQLLTSLGEQFQRKVANLARTNRSEAEALIKDFGERLERQILPSLQRQEQVGEKLTESLDQTTKEQAAKLDEIDRVVSALGQRVDGLIASWTEVERANSARRTGLAESLESKVKALVEAGHTDSQLAARAFENRLAELNNTTRAEAAKTTALISSLEEKIAALAQKGWADSEAQARSLYQQIEGDVSKLGQNTHAELSRTIALVGSLEVKIAALADNGRKDTATLARTLQSSFQEQTEATRAEAERTTTLARSLETKVAALSAQTQAEAVSLAKALSQQIETQALRFTENAQSESEKTAALVHSLEQKIAALAQTDQAHSEAIAKALHQKIETHAREAAENTRAEVARTTSSIELLEKQITQSSEDSRAEAAKTVALLDGKITALAQQTEANSESLARTLGQQIEHQAQALVECTRGESARTTALIDSLERSVTAHAEKARAVSESLVKGLGQEMAGHVLHLTDNSRTANAKTLELIGALEDRIAMLAEQGRSDSEALARTLSQEIERHALELTQSARAQATAAAALLENKIATLSGQVQADTELVAKAINRQLESSVQQLTERTQAEGANTATLIGSLETKIAAMAENVSAESAALAKSLTQRVDGHAQQLGEKIRAESAGTTAFVEEKIAALAESAKADTESVGRILGQKIEVYAQQLTETTRAEAAKTSGLLESKIVAVAEKTQASTEAVAKSLAQQVESHARALLESTQAEAAKAAALVEALRESVVAAAAKGSADSESLKQALGQQIESRALDLVQNTRTEIAKTNTLLEEKIAALIASGKAVSESLTQTLSQHIESQVHGLTEVTRAEAVRTTNLFENKIAEFTETNRAAFELQANTLGTQLKAKLAELSEAHHVQTAELRKRLDMGIEAIEREIATSSETSREDLQARLNVTDERFYHRLEELAQQNTAKTKTLADTLLHRMELGADSLREGTRAESVAVQSLLRTLTQQIYLRVVAFTDGVRNESENTNKKIDALRNSIDRSFDALAESSQEHHPRLPARNGGPVESPDAIEAQLSHAETAKPDEAQFLREHSLNGGHPHSPTNGHGSNGASRPAETIETQYSQILSTNTHGAEGNGHAVAAEVAEVNGGEKEQKNGIEPVMNGRSDDKSNGFDTNDPCDPLGATPEEVLIFEETSKRKPRVGFARRLFRLNRTKD